ncbi:4Fe-4S ferredoxin iron-sulfur binding domain protein [Candidatus Moduliflexus flocculans]|uniref:4Fe-4S ferredoxin iron-sulfur binding domain protein n=1 Tax=Candidatus Moduliflexus flocculans TaxID=1499966 RepID=A0A081BQH5_9BACT|nr:4Fe-4S ferredoxin iron-sulfur binding domain protein [Candidatus Moduliflexus flocculans]
MFYNVETEMQYMKNCVIHYFSGTGNTQRAAGILFEQLNKPGIGKCALNNIEQNSSVPLDSHAIHIFMFPVYAGAAPAIMVHYLMNLPSVQGGSAAIIAITGRTEHRHGDPMQALDQASRILARKGFQVQLTDAVEAVANFGQFLNPPTPEAQQQILREADARIREIAEQIRQQQTSIRISAIWIKYAAWCLWAIYTVLARRVLGKLYVADQACTGCGQCAHFCPAAAIRLFHGVPRWNFQCEGCQRCMNICPTHAIQVSFLRLFVMLMTTVLFPIAVFIHFLALHGIVLSLFFTVLTTIGVVVCADVVVFLLELIPAMRYLTTASHTRRYRRYLAPDFLKTLARTHRDSRNSLDNSSRGY